MVSKHIMHRVYASHRRRSLARLRFTRDRQWRDCGDGCGVGLSHRCRRRLCWPFTSLVLDKHCTIARAE